MDIVLFKKKEDCCGCGACLNICPKDAITMKEDEYGFLYPYINIEKCIKCKLCKKVCYFQNEDVKNEPIKTYAGVLKDKERLKNSASGGIFVGLAKSILDNKGIVYGAAFSKEWNVKHIDVKNNDELVKLQGSKYTQSNTEKTYLDTKRALTEGKVVLYSGTPCQIHGLYGFLGKDYDNLLTVDIICHGVPNNKMFKEYLKYLEGKNDGKINSFTFRDKSLGWGKNGKVKILSNGRIKNKKLWESSSSYLYYFSKGWICRESCYKCKYASSKRPADLTIGDYWGIENMHPEYLNKKDWNEKNGISGVIFNSEKSINFFENIYIDIDLKKSCIKKLSKNNAQLKYPSNPEKREEILREYIDNGWDGVENLFNKKIGIMRFSSQIKYLIPNYIKKNIKKIL